MRNGVVGIILIILIILGFVYIYRHSTIVGNSVIIDFGKENKEIEETKEINSTEHIESQEKNNENKGDWILLFFMISFTIICSIVLVILLKYLKKISLEVNKNHSHSTWLE